MKNLLSFLMEGLSPAQVTAAVQTVESNDHITVEVQSPKAGSVLFFPHWQEDSSIIKCQLAFVLLTQDVIAAVEAV